MCRWAAYLGEPDREREHWQAIPPSSFVTMTRSGLTIRPFMPASEDEMALAG